MDQHPIQSAATCSVAPAYVSDILAPYGVVVVAMIVRVVDFQSFKRLIESELELELLPYVSHRFELNLNADFSR